MTRRTIAVLLIVGCLAGCATVAPDNATTFIAQYRGEARTLETKGALADARLRWRYVAALSPNDAEASAEIQRLAGVIRERRDALVRQGEAVMKAGRAAQARTFYLKALALDGTDARARGALADMDQRAMLAFQEKKDQKDQKAMSEYMAQVRDAQGHDVRAPGPARAAPSPVPSQTSASAPVSGTSDPGGDLPMPPPSFGALKR
jgi:hypothetical protein